MRDNPALAIAAGAQLRAADPATSAWVSASAGSGKTKVLTDRVLNLLLEGTPPGKILCVTFTKAAAAEMANRIQDRLARWATADQADLEEDVRALTADRFDPRHMHTARRLFADVLDAPQSLRIETLHAFCQSVLRRFPLEAGLSPHFDLLSDEDAKALLTEQEERVLGSGASEALEEALAFVTARQHETRFTELLARIISQRGSFQSMLKHHGGTTGTRAALAARLGVPKDITPDDVIEQTCTEPALPEDTLTKAAEILSASTKKTDQDKGRALAAWLSDPANRVRDFAAYTNVFLTQKQEPRKTLCTKTVSDNYPDVASALEQEQHRLLHARDQIRAATVLQASWALAVIADALLSGYGTAKSYHGQLDYDDLINRAGGLLNRAEMAAWVLFKLDGGIDHVLVDETQDTNQTQWDILNALTEEFFAGTGQDRPEGSLARTLFAVGDAKQSIYRFQGADPEAFHRMQHFHQDRIEASTGAWRLENLAVSFRSAPAVLQAVDAVFGEGQPARRGMAEAEHDITHLAARKDVAGRVELWPLVPTPEAPVLEPWRPPVEDKSEPSARDQLAGLLARRIAAMIEAKDARAGDVMVLVRRRSGFVDELVRQLKWHQVPVAGADRLRLIDHIAVMDLMALGDVLLLPEDDLSLACVLKSPLIGLSEEALFELAHARDGTLWQALAAHAGSGNAFGKAHGLLEALAARVDFDSPYELFAHILATGGLKRFQSRLGVDVQDPLQAFLSEALRYEQEHPASLQGFLQWLRSADVEIKRELDQTGADAVRIMTVHGAKGLQAPIVILPDTTSVPPPPGGLYPDRAEDLVFWAPKVDDLDPVTHALRDQLKADEEAEQNRLLYVAMTRAEDRLILCGWAPHRALPDGCWYNRVADALSPVASTSDNISDDMAAVFNTNHMLVLADPEPDTLPPHDPPLVFEKDPIPARLREPPSPEPVPSRPLAQSETRDETPSLPPFGAQGSDPYARGRVIHALLEHLPDVEHARREEVAVQLASREGHRLTEEDRRTAVAEALAVLEAPEWHVLFSPNSQAEVPVTGVIDGQVISARLDRLSVTEDTVWIADYKTNRPPPDDIKGTPKAYVEQLDCYRALMQQIFPEHDIRCLLVWTHSGTAMEIPKAMLDQPVTE